jgi:hypothetical protein
MQHFHHGQCFRKSTGCRPETGDCGTSTVGGLEAPVNPEQFASFNERWAGLVKKKS